MDTDAKPIVYVLAGPNGAGKTTFANLFLPTFAECRELLDGSTFPPTRVIEIVDGREQVFDYDKWNLIKQQGKEVQSD